MNKEYAVALTLMKLLKKYNIMFLLTVVHALLVEQSCCLLPKHVFTTLILWSQLKIRANVW